MPDQDAMAIDERRNCLPVARPRYGKADRRGRGVLLDEMQLVTGLELCFVGQDRLLFMTLG